MQINQFFFKAMIVFVGLLVFPTGAFSQNRNQVQIAVIGDSHVEVLGPQLLRRAESNGRRLRFEACRGSQAIDWANDPARGAWINETNPEIVIMNFGTNEAVANKRVAQLAGAVKKLAERFSNGGKRTIVWVMPPRLEGLGFLKNVWALKNTVTGVYVLDFSDKRYPPNASKIHLTGHGYELWAKDIAWRLKL